MNEKKVNIVDFKAMAKNELIEELMLGTIKGGCCEYTWYGNTATFDPVPEPEPREEQE